MMQDFEILRRRMVENQLISRNIKSDSVLDAMDNVPRHLFIPGKHQGYAYDDEPVPIGFGQTISQPYIVAFMTEQLEPVPRMKILEVGTGSGYQAAILSYLGCRVYSVELVEALAAKAQKILSDLDFDNVKSKHGDGFSGWPEEAPFDAIIVTAAPDIIPEKLFEQLKEGGRMIIPVGGAHSVQWLKLITKRDGRIAEKDLIPVRFVPMLKRK